MSPGPENLDRRALLRAVTAGACLSVLAGCGVRPDSASVPSLDRQIDDLTARLDPGQGYRSPSRTETRRAVAAVEQLTAGDIDAARSRFAALGFTVDRLYDVPAQRDYLVAAAQKAGPRSWGMLVVPAHQGRPDILIEVPHPRADRHTERIGLGLLRTVADAGLLLAGAHRRAADGAADVAHQPGSLFHAVAHDYGRQGALQLQLHGFADDSLPGTDVVISSGRTRAGRRVRQLADALDGIGLDVRRAWRDGCGVLEGTTNAQGRAAARDNLEFVHVELNHSTRTDEARRDAVIGALAGALNDVR